MNFTSKRWKLNWSFVLFFKMCNFRTFLDRYFLANHKFCIYTALHFFFQIVWHYVLSEMGKQHWNLEREAGWDQKVFWPRFYVLCMHRGQSLEAVKTLGHISVISLLTYLGHINEVLLSTSYMWLFLDIHSCLKISKIVQKETSTYLPTSSKTV